MGTAEEKSMDGRKNGVLLKWSRARSGSVSQCCARGLCRLIRLPTRAGPLGGCTTGPYQFHITRRPRAVRDSIRALILLEAGADFALLHSNDLTSPSLKLGIYL